MKRVLFKIFFLFFFSQTAYALDEVSALESYKSYVDGLIGKAKQVYGGNSCTWINHVGDEWKKIYTIWSDKYEIDLEKTKSLVKPYVGTFDIKTYSWVKDFKSKGGAEQAKVGDPTILQYFRLQIHYSNEEWTVTKSQYKGKNDTEWYDVPIKSNWWPACGQ